MNAFSFLPALLLAGSAAAADWPQFRGPQACGVDSAAPAPVRWNVEKNENVRWRAAIPGLAHSCPILWGDRVYVTTAVQPGKAELKVGLYGDIEPVAAEGPQQWRLLALDQSTGKVLWDKVAHEAMPRSQHPNAIPKRLIAIAPRLPTAVALSPSSAPKACSVLIWRANNSGKKIWVQWIPGITASRARNGALPVRR